MESLGQRLFTKRQTPLLSLASLGFAVACGFGAFRSFKSTTQFEGPVGVLLSVLSVGFILGAMAIATTRWDFFRDGVVQRRLWRITALRFDEIDVYEYVEVLHETGRRAMWAMHCSGGGRTIRVVVTPAWGAERDLPRLNALLVPRLTGYLRGKLERGVRWGELTLRRHGVESRHGHFPLSAIELRRRRGTAAEGSLEVVEVVAGQVVIAKIGAGSPNAAIGMRLLIELAPQHAPQVPRPG